MIFSRRSFANALLSVGVAAALSSAIAAGPAASPHVVLKTTAGEIVLELNAEKAPKSVDNFLQYVKSGQYDGTVFHRVINGFMIQGGGFDADMREKPTRAAIANEAKNGLKNVAYTVAMARTSDSDSATAQFFINVADNGVLDYPGRDGAGYAVFGKVIKGNDVVDKIRAVPTTDRGMNQNVPVKPVVITTARIVP